jgi:alkylhydroperoxidase family enzyme
VSSFLAEPEPTPETQAMYDDDLADLGFVMNGSRLWAQHPEAQEALFELLGLVNAPVRFSLRERGILVAACAATLGDSYCSLAWGGKLAEAADGPLAASVLRGEDAGLSDAERAMARWARAVVADPNATTAEDVEELRRAGWDERQIFAMTVFVALRQAFSTVNDALGAIPDAGLRQRAPQEVLDAVTWGRPMEPAD